MKVTAVKNDWVGRVIDERFPLRQWLGGSAGGGVYLTELPGTAQKAAIKLIPAEAGAEARIVYAVDANRTQRRLVRIFENGICEIDGATFVYVVTEYADEVLSEILPMRPLIPEEVKEMLVPVLDALTDLHAQGMVHGRLKPSNILVINDELKLSADSIQPAGATADPFAAVSIFDSPERAGGTLSPASDMWSLGVTIVEALTQRTPDWNRATNRDPKLTGDLPRPFADIAASCLRVDPAARATLNDVKRSLGLPMQAVAAPVRAQESEPASEPRPAGKPRPAVLISVVVALVAVIALVWSRSHGTTPATPLSNEPAAQSSAPAAEPAKPAPLAQPQAQETPKDQPAPAQATPEPQQPPPDQAATPAPAKAATGSASAKGAVAQRVMPEILEQASQSIQGKVNVRVRLNVSPAGEVTDSSFESAGPSKYFARVAMEAARQWKFTPPQEDGQPVASVWTIHFLFTRGNTEVTPAQTTP